MPSLRLRRMEERYRALREELHQTATPRRDSPSRCSLWTRCNEPPNRRVRLIPAEALALTGRVDEDGHVHSVAADTLSTKLEAYFFSPVEILAVPDCPDLNQTGGVKELLVCGTSNAYYQEVLVVLDPRMGDKHGPVTSEYRRADTPLAASMRCPMETILLGAGTRFGTGPDQDGLQSRR